MIRLDESRTIHIGLDFDDCYTRDHEFFDHFIDTATARGHKVHIVTMRPPEDYDMLRDIIHPQADIYTTDLKAKRPFMEAKGINIDIWIDDRPQYVNEDHRYQSTAGTRQRRVPLIR